MDEQIASALAEARALGFLGPGSLEQHEASAASFVDALGPVEGRALDLGSGGGVPGLLLAAHYAEVAWVLLDINRRRTSFLARTVAVLGWADRVAVCRKGADVAARTVGLRGGFDLVVARSFALPAVTAECAVGFLHVGGRLAVAEPPGASGERWDQSALLELGLVPERTGRVQVLRQQFDAPQHVPRTWRAMDRSPLWGISRET